MICHYGHLWTKIQSLFVKRFLGSSLLVSEYALGPPAWDQPCVEEEFRLKRITLSDKNKRVWFSLEPSSSSQEQSWFVLEVYGTCLHSVHAHKWSLLWGELRFPFCSLWGSLLLWSDLCFVLPMCMGLWPGVCAIKSFVCFVSLETVLSICNFLSAPQLGNLRRRKPSPGAPALQRKQAVHHRLPFWVLWCPGSSAFS